MNRFINLPRIILKLEEEGKKTHCLPGSNIMVAIHDPEDESSMSKAKRNRVLRVFFDSSILGMTIGVAIFSKEETKVTR